MNSAESEIPGRSRRRRRHRRYQPVRLNRKTEIWLVAGTSLALLGGGISWMMSLAYPTGPQAETPTAAQQDINGPSPQALPPVIILEDKASTESSQSEK